MEIQFFVPGFPKAQGSKRHVGRGIMVEMSKDLGPWRQAIAEYAKAEANGQVFLGPLWLRAVFVFPRLKSHFGTGRNAGYPKRNAPVWKETAPDLDKLFRALCDGLVISGVIRDDAPIVKMEGQKRYGDPGVLVNLQTLERDQRKLGERASSLIE